MGVIRPGPIVADIRGSIGDVTFARNRGGIYAYQRNIPAYTRTADQDACRKVMEIVTPTWYTTLTEAQRKAWRTYAAQHPLPDTWGNPRYASGITWYTRTNAYVYRGRTLISWPNPPAKAPLWMTNFTITASAATGRLYLTFPTQQYNPPPANLYNWIFCSKPKNAGATSFRGQWRYVGYYYFATPFTPYVWNVLYPWPLTPGQKVWAALVPQEYTSGALGPRSLSSCSVS